MKKYYNELTDTIITELEFIADCKQYIDSLDTEECKPDLKEVMLNTDYIYLIDEE